MRWIRANVGRQIKVIDIDHVLYSSRTPTRVVLAESEALIRTPIKDLLSQLDPREVLANPPRHDRRGRGHRRGGTHRRRAHAGVKGGSVKLPVSRGFTHLFRSSRAGHA
jgi:hypothetical protein